MKVDMNNPVPDVCEAVTYDGRGYRVTGWMKLQRLEEPDDEIVREVLREGHYPRYKLVPCLRDEATAIDIYSVAGFIVRPDEVEREGVYIEWTDARIREEQKSAVRRANNKDKLIWGLGRGYEKLLHRLYPDIDLYE